MNHPAAASLAKPSDTVASPRRGSAPAWAHVVWILLAILVFAPTIYWLWQRWTMSIWQNVHGMFIPFIVGYFIFRVLRSDPVADVEQSAWGFLFLIPGLSLVVLDSAIRTQLLSAFGMVICLPGLSLLLSGSRRTRALTFAWLLSFLMLPIPAAFIEGLLVLLRRITTVGSQGLIALLGVPVLRDGTMLLLPDTNMSIGDGCSGFSVLYASVTLALIFAYFNKSWPRRLLTLALAFPIAVACNIVRCSMLGLAAERWGSGILDTALHPLSGMLTFTAAAALMTYVGLAEMRRSAT